MEKYEGKKKCNLMIALLARESEIEGERDEDWERDRERGASLECAVCTCEFKLEN